MLKQPLQTLREVTGLQGITHQSLAVLVWDGEFFNSVSYPRKMLLVDFFVLMDLRPHSHAVLCICSLTVRQFLPRQVSVQMLHDSREGFSEGLSPALTALHRALVFINPEKLLLM